MSTLISRIYNWVTDKGNNVKITASRMDEEMDQVIVALNRKVLCAAAASPPSSPIAGQTWVDTTNKVLKIYRNNEWVIMGALHVGASAPSTLQEGDVWYDTDNDILKVYDGSSWLSLQTTANIPNDAITRGFELVYNNTTSVKVNPGTLFHGTTKINKTSIATLTLATAGDWWDGATDDYSGGAGWCYIGVNSSGDIKFLGANPPDKADTSGNTDGTKLYWYDSSAYWRVIGAIRVNTSNQVDYKFYQEGDKIFYTVRQIALNNGTALTYTDVDLSSYIPDITQLVYLTVDGNSTAHYLRVNGETTDWIYPTSNQDYACWIPTDSSRKIEYKEDPSAAGLDIYVNGYSIGGLR